MLARGSGSIANAANLAQTIRANPRGGKDCGDHPPITPCRSVGVTELSGDDWRLYEYIALHFIATLSKDMKYLSQDVELKVGSETFVTTSNKVVDPGWTAFMPWKSVGDEDEDDDFCESSSAELVKGQTYDIDTLSLDKNETRPPGYLSESELIGLMEKHSIGTDASIPVHIQNIQTRNYVELASGRKLIPTKLGITLIHGFQKIDFELIAPKMRAEVENQLELIGKGKADFKRVLNHTLSIFQRKFLFYVDNMGTIDRMFETSFTTVASSGKPFTRCGKCCRYLKLIEKKPPRLYCQKCEDTLVSELEKMKLYQNQI